MTGSTILEVKHVSQRFSQSLRDALRYGVKDIFQHLLPSHADQPRQLRKGEFWALHDVSFDLKAGESIGILGKNGAGKSTLLKLIAGIYQPTAGHIRVGGRIGAIVELGSAFSPNLSGRENIRIQALLHGYTPELLRRQMEAILAFADLGDFIDSPVQQYSTGMRARLGFSVAIHGNPDLLLVDEVLAVGDISFQNKCLRLVEAFRKQGGSVLFVGHNPFQMQAACERGIILDRGCVQFDGPIVDAIDIVLRSIDSAPPLVHGLSTTGDLPFDQEETPNLSGFRPPFEVLHTAVSYERQTADAQLGDASINFTLRVDRPSVRLNGMAAFFPQHDPRAIAVSITDATALSSGEQKLTMKVPSLPLVPGHYLVKLCLLDERSAFSLWNQGWTDKPFDLKVPGETGHHANIVRAIHSNILLPSHIHKLDQ